MIQYKLVRKEDDIALYALQRWFIGWTESGFGKEAIENIKIGYSCLMGPKNMFYVWLTTPVTEILEDSEERIHFKTKNSEYLLTKEEVESTT